MKKPKPFVTPLVAGARLIHLVLEHILLLREGIEVRWELDVKYRYSDAAKESVEGPAILNAFAASSGEMPKEETPVAVPNDDEEGEKNAPRKAV